MNGYARCSRALSWAVGAGYNHTVSAHVGYAVITQRAPQRFWRAFAKLLDKVFVIFEENHCRASAERYFAHPIDDEPMEFDSGVDPRTSLLYKD